MILYTDAPASYDYSYMTEIGEHISEWDGRTYRVLSTDDEYRAVNFQMPRYRSGLYFVMEHADFLRWEMGL